MFSIDLAAILGTIAGITMIIASYAVWISKSTFKDLEKEIKELKKEIHALRIEKYQIFKQLQELKIENKIQIIKLEQKEKQIIELNLKIKKLMETKKRKEAKWKK